MKKGERFDDISIQDIVEEGGFSRIGLLPELQDQSRHT
jgi:hypothetical protein